MAETSRSLFLQLRKAHRENDKTVMATYGFKKDMTEAEIVGELFKMYEDLTKAQ
ncbi:MAG: hypothetical protein K6B43_06505 [Treponema sp.]|nr:hypothetical protein [Treponema sp.]